MNNDEHRRRLARPANPAMLLSAANAAHCPPQQIAKALCERRGDEVTTLARLPIPRAPFCVHHSDYLDLVFEMPKHYEEWEPTEKVASCARFIGRPSRRRFRDLRQRVVKFLGESVTKAGGLFLVERPRCGGFSNSLRVEPERQFAHLPVINLRASSQSTVSTEPSSSCLSLSATSARHLESMSASNGSSRLSISDAAKRERASSGRAKAFSRSFAAEPSIPLG
jgi:hypothetical protein